MTYPRGEVTVPVRVAEMLFVAFSMTLDEVERTTDYSRELLDNMRQIVKAYDADRTKALTARGLTPIHVQNYTEAATKKLLQWILDRESKSQAAQHDLAQWAEELLKNDPEDSA